MAMVATDGVGCVVIAVGISAATIMICAVVNRFFKQDVYFLLVFAVPNGTLVRSMRPVWLHVQ